MSEVAAMFGFDPPAIDATEVLAIARDHWGVTGSTTRLRGERSHNTRITASEDSAWILQIQSASEDPLVIDLQTEAMRHLARSAPNVPVSRVVPTTSGEVHATVDIAGRRHLVRLVTFLPGTTFDPAIPLPPTAYERIGELLGSIAAGLADFEHPAAAHPMPWDVANGLIVDDELRRDLSSPSTDALRLVDDRLERTMGIMTSLPRHVIHNDGHAGNLIRPDPSSHQVSGVIDFGDLVRTVTVADVAIIAESFAPDHPDPAGVVAAIAVGYHGRLPLSDAEIAAIPDLVLARTALNVLLGEFQIRHAPHLADGAAAALDSVVDRMLRWNRLDPDAMITRIHDALDLRRTVP